MMQYDTSFIQYDTSSLLISVFGIVSSTHQEFLPKLLSGSIFLLIITLKLRMSLQNI